MNSILKRLKERKSSDRGDSNTISFLFAFVVLIMFFISVLDVGFYFNNRNIITNTATNGARLASIYGGVGDEKGTPIAQAYGNKVEDCKFNSNPVVCSIERELEHAPLLEVEVRDINCGPKNTTKLGQRTYCEIKWEYAGLPGSVFSFIKVSSKGHKPGEGKVRTTRISAESEVITNGK